MSQSNVEGGYSLPGDGISACVVMPFSMGIDRTGVHCSKKTSILGASDFEIQGCSYLKINHVEQKETLVLIALVMLGSGVKHDIKKYTKRQQDSKTARRQEDKKTTSTMTAPPVYKHVFVHSV